ncbi:hypothetical protein [Sporosarcina sp. FSL K6-3457]|uniref:hypothetical protein n=1 Tax=Sporosarcina sp. FSL K6-3457 TaxID=2978204 RepID=UPI0030F83633
MNRTFMKHELAITSKSRKNIPFIVFLGVFLFSYCLVILPNQETNETFRPIEVKEFLDNVHVEQSYREQKGYTGINVMSGVPVYATNAHYDTLYYAMLTAYEDHDFNRYLRLRTFYLEGHMHAFIGDPTLFTESPMPRKDATHLYYQTMLRFDDYLKNDYKVSYGMIHEKTGLQVLQNILLNYGMYLFLFCVIYLSSDILVRDRQYRTVLQGFPLSWYRLLNLKTLSVFLYSLLVIMGLIIAGVFVVSLQYGFGSFEMKVPVMIAQQFFTLKDYDVITTAQFLLKSLSVIPVLAYLFIRLNLVLSLLLKNEWLVLTVSSLILFSERFYFTRTSRELFGIDISYFPQTYFDFGKIITGEKNFLLNTETITYVKGIIVLLITILLIEGMLIIVSRIVNKRSFYQTR